MPNLTRQLVALSKSVFHFHGMHCFIVFPDQTASLTSSQFFKPALNFSPTQTAHPQHKGQSLDGSCCRSSLFLRIDPGSGNNLKPY
eukprot:6482698-Amphidinium_carterae.1